MQFALGGEAALQACEAGSFDVVVSDMRMPGMDGATLLGHIRDRFPSTREIILSGYSEAALASARSSRGAPLSGQAMRRVRTSSPRSSGCARCRTCLNTPEIRSIVGTVGELPSLSTTYTCPHCRR